MPAIEEPSLQKFRGETCAPLADRRDDVPFTARPEVKLWRQLAGHCPNSRACRLPHDLVDVSIGNAGNRAHVITRANLCGCTASQRHKKLEEHFVERRGHKNSEKPETA